MPQSILIWMLHIINRWKCKVAQWFASNNYTQCGDLQLLVKAIQTLVNMPSHNWHLLEKDEARFKFYSGTITCFIVKFSVQFGFSDVKNITKQADYFGIAKEISHYPDLTPTWKCINFDPVPFINHVRHGQKLKLPRIINLYGWIFVTFIEC